MKKILARRWPALLLAAVLLLGAIVPSAVFARDWWIMEAIYTVADREPDPICGPEARVFLPTVAVTTIDFIEEDAVWSMTKDGEEIASGEYAPGLFVDLTGAGNYVLTITGVDASNSLTYEITARDDVASFISEAMIPVNSSLSEPFSAPKAEIVMNGERKQAAVTLLMASGSMYENDGKAASETGLMTVRYSAEAGGETVSKDFEVIVFDDSLGFYGEDGTFYPSFVTPLSKFDVSGCNLNGSSDEKYTFSQIIDLSACTKDVPLIVLDNGSEESNVYPHVFLVDVYNPTNYIEIVGRMSADNNNMVYTVAAASGGTMVGFLGGTNFYNGTIFGTETTFARSALADRSTPAKYYFDAAEKAVYANWYGSVNLITDLDADYQMKSWPGFTTGEVYLQVKRHSSDDFVLVESVCGRSLGAPASDTIAPALKIDAPESVPHAIAGQAYPVFAAAAVDYYESKLPVSVRVFQGCSAFSGVEMNVADGCFVPTDAGWYTIVYSACDSYGNRVTSNINVPTYSASEAPAIAAEIADIPKSALIGEKIEVPRPDSITGGSGEVSCVVTLTTPDGETNELSEKELLLSAEGKNVLTYTLTDYLGDIKTYEFPIQCTATDKPILYELQMPETILSGGLFEIPAAEQYEANQAEVTVTAKLDGKKLDVNGNTVAIETTKDQAKLELTYTATNSAGSSSRTYTIPVLTADLSDRTSYFKVESGSFDIVQKESAISLTTTESDSAVRFANAVLAEKLSLQFSVDPERNDADRLSVLIYDSVQTDIAVRLDMVKKDNGTDTDKTKFYINGVPGNDMVGNFYGGVASLGLTYKKSTGAFVDSEGNALGRITTTLNGEPFNGFPSGKVFLAVSSGTVGEKGFCFSIAQINNQVFADDTLFFDNYPEISTKGTLALLADVGDTVEIPAAFACDVLSPNVSLTVSARRDMNALLDGAAIDKPITLTLDAYGTYFVSYNYTDGTIERSVSYQIQAIEHNAPEGEEVSLPEEVKLGARVELPQMNASDDASEITNVSVIVREPNNNMHNILPEAMYFDANRAGTWTVMYYVYDACWNYRVYTYEITVK